MAILLFLVFTVSVRSFDNKAFRSFGLEFWIEFEEELEEGVVEVEDGVVVVEDGGCEEGGMLGGWMEEDVVKEVDEGMEILEEEKEEDVEGEAEVKIETREVEVGERGGEGDGMEVIGEMGGREEELSATSSVAAGTAPDVGAVCL